MSNTYFRFKQFTIHQDQTAMKVTTDSCLFGAWVAREIQSIQNPSRVLDIGTGTGLLSLMIAQKNDIVIDAVEIDNNAAVQARQNISNSKWKNRVHLFEDDILRFEGNKQYSVIVSNPPFYENELSSPNPLKNIAHHSEQLKLDQLISIIKQRLIPTGEFFILLPLKREMQYQMICESSGLYINKKVLLKQTVTHKGFRVMLRGSFLNSTMAVSAIGFKDEDNNYTPPFIELLKEYYLNL
jgi:tRNA1Val (adenine37-N6)-methyltransferase